MTTVVVPFAGSAGKTRVDAPSRVREHLSFAMLADVLSAASAVGHIVIVTGDEAGADLARAWYADVVADPGAGQGPAVQAALAQLADEPVLVVNADLPCTTPADLCALLEAIPSHGLALVEALDGTTNALGLSEPGVFKPVYGRDSARRFLALEGETLSVAIPNLAEDVDTLADLERLQFRCGPRTQSCLCLT